MPPLNLKVKNAPPFQMAATFLRLTARAIVFRKQQIDKKKWRAKSNWKQKQDYEGEELVEKAADCSNKSKVYAEWPGGAQLRPSMKMAPGNWVICQSDTKNPISGKSVCSFDWLFFWLFLIFIICKLRFFPRRFDKIHSVSRAAYDLFIFSKFVFSDFLKFLVLSFPAIT